jgi:ubiquinone/menaquinone biosynthesis C-methylase UbiE
MTNYLQTLAFLHRIDMSAYGLVQKRDIRSMLTFLPAKSSVLDVGCGFGGPSQQAAEIFNLSACDIQPSPSNISSLRFHELVMELRGIEFRWINADKLPYEDQKFDGVLLYAVVEHVSDKTALLNECNRVLKPGGIVYMFRAVNAKAFAEYLASVLGYPTHGKDVVSLNQILAVVQQTGFDVMKWGYQGWFPEYRLPRVPIFVINALLTRIPIIRRFSHDFFFVCRKISQQG